MSSRNRVRQSSFTQNSCPKNKLSQEQVNSLADQARENLSEEQLSNALASIPTNDFKIEDCWQKAKNFEAALENIKAKLEQVENRQKELQEQETQIQTSKVEVEKQRQKITEYQEKYYQRTTELSQLERQLHERELNAEAGFIVQNRAALAELQTQTQELSKVRQQLYKNIAEAQKNLDSEIAQKSAELDQELTEKRQEIENEQRQSDAARRQLRLEQRRLETEKELLEEDKQALEAKIEQKAGVEVERLKVRIQILDEQLKLAQTQRSQFQSILIQRQEADRRFGQKTPEEVLEGLEILRREKAELEQKLASRLSENAAARLQELESQKEEWETERFRLSTRLQELERNITFNRIAVTELETLRDEKEALDASNNRLRAALRELKAEVDDAVAQSKDKSPFPECFRMDGDARLQAKIPLCQDIPDLKEFAEDLRDRIALSPLIQDETTQKRLYYSERDIRAFLGGLAMSHLHILQGISGTGKTSLPVAFARAVLGGYKLVEVQAGWRDRQDLIGYFNAFEGKFYESDFLKAIYEAQCPANRERIYIIILDEMNLSRPEQYFADFLSKLNKILRKLG